MTGKEFSDLIDRAERIITIIDKWGGVDGLVNRIDLIDEYLKKMDAKKDVIIQLDKLGNNMFIFKNLLTVDEAARYLDVHRNTVYKLIKTKGLMTYSPPSSKMLILTEDLVQWCKQYPNGDADVLSKGNYQKKKGTRK